MGITDIDMPGGSGLELIQYVKEEFPNIEKFFLTCHADFQFAQQAVRLGCVDYLLKPVDYSEVDRNLMIAVGRLKEKKIVEEKNEIVLVNQNSLNKQFWLDILRGSVPSNLSSIINFAQKRGVHYSEESLVFP